MCLIFAANTKGREIGSSENQGREMWILCTSSIDRIWGIALATIKHSLTQILMEITVWEEVRREGNRLEYTRTVYFVDVAHVIKD